MQECGCREGVMAMEKESKLIWPDYGDCLVNIPNSVLKGFGEKPLGVTHPFIDTYLEKEYKNVVLFLLDGMGVKILEKHLKEDGAFRSHLAGTTQSVFLSTTVAATVSAITGLHPCEHSWLGWDCYYPSIDRNVTVFLNVIQGTDCPAADYHVANSVTPYESVVDKLNKAGHQAYDAMPFAPPFPGDAEAICERIKRLCRKDGKKYIYAYWNQPDGLLHRYGCESEIVTQELTYLEEMITAMASELEDTLLIVTADHGHIDTDVVYLKDYPALWECLERCPSLEPRVLNLFVKEERKEFFVKEFNKEFGEKFLLMPMEDVIAKNLMGTGKNHEQFRQMLGNYLAIATGDLTILFTEEEFKSMHGSITEDEMLIPLIIFDNKNEK